MFWIYFLVILTTELYMLWFYNFCKVNIHPFAILFFVLFLLWIFKDIFKNKDIFKIVLLCTFFVFFITIVKCKNAYDKQLILLMVAYYLYIPLAYIYNQINNSDEVSILEKQNFWISISLLIWIIFFIFKMIPYYYLNQNDKQFLETIDLIFQTANMLSYILFIKALICKQ